MGKSRKLNLRKSSKSRKSKRCGGYDCKKCSCGGTMYYNNKSGVSPYCICRKCGKSYSV